MATVYIVHIFNRQHRHLQYYTIQDLQIIYVHSKSIKNAMDEKYHS